MEKTVGELPVPNDWHVLNIRRDAGGIHTCVWQKLFGAPLRVIESVCVNDDGKNWLHVSVSHPKGKMPSYEDLAIVRKLFIGEDRECYMIFPPKERYVNINPNVLHLYCCLDAPKGVLPHMEGMLNGQLSV